MDFSLEREVGVDLVHVPRIAEKMHDERFLRRIFSEAERADAGDGPHRAERLAARWAVKEATAKALGCGIGEQLSFLDVELVRSANGCPSVRLSESAATRFGYPVLKCSLSHDGDYAIAVVLLLPSTRTATPEESL